MGLLAYAAWSDFREYLIPNRIIVGLLVLYPAFVLTAPTAVDWTISVAIAAGILTVGFILFATNHMGGGDVKLLMATGLWAGPEWGSVNPSDYLPRRLSTPDQGLSPFSG